jgi:hypothetical protein
LTASLSGHARSRGFSFWDQWQDNPHCSAKPFFRDYFEIAPRHTDQLAGLESSDPVAARFCRTKRQEQLVANKRVVHAWAAVSNVDQELGSDTAGGNDHPIAWTGYINRILNKVSQRGSQALRVDRYSTWTRLVPPLHDDRTIGELGEDGADDEVRVE